MAMTKRQLLKTTVAAGFIAILGGIPAFAEGGNDPIGGIDIIVKEDPGSQRVVKFSLSGGEVKRFNALKGSERSAYLAKIAAPYLAKVGEGRSEKEWAGMLTDALGDNWCGPCRMVGETLARDVKMKDGISAFITATF
ncbi:MAG: hypothetical protein COA53_00435 [Rhodobacteraceae bacterium]|nr:MAG: hypothetical protein COA53_00435 [Paracoccaceae bacterium]